MQFKKNLLIASILLTPVVPSLLASPQDTPQTSISQGSKLLAVPLGPDDEITLAAPDIEELDRRVLKVQSDGNISVPMIGPLKAAGLTPAEFQKNLTEALKTQFRDPQVSFSSIDIHSKPVSVLGAVNKPGIEQAQGQKSLLEMLSLAGGLRPDAGTVVTVTRHSSDASSFPAEVRPTLAGNYVVAEIPVSSLMDGTVPANNVPIFPGDVITVPKGRMVYVVGDVKRSGGFVLGENETLTVIKALSLAEGFDNYADTGHARILRANKNGERTEQVFDFKKLLDGKTEDIALRADDILYIPNSTSKKVLAKSIEAMVSLGTGFAIYRR
jgi:polysaccharide biosynthesis/export protein